MKLSNYLSMASNLYGENRLLKFVVVVMCIMTTFNTCSVMRAQTMEKIVLTPNRITDDMWIAGDKASEQYIRNFVMDVMSYYLTYHPANVRTNFDNLLKMYHPTEFDRAKKYLSDLASRVEESKASSSFYMTKLVNDEKKHQLEITGVRVMIINEKVAEQVTRNYTLEYRIESGRFSIIRLLESKELDQIKAEEKNEKM